MPEPTDTKAPTAPSPYPQRLRRYALLLFAAWTLVLAVLLVRQISLAEETTMALAEKEAEANFNKDQAFRFWATQHGGVYVPVSKKTPPNPYLDQLPERDITTPSGRRLTLMNPAYMLRQLNEDFTELFGVRGHITSLRLMRPENAPDAWERAVLESFENGVREVSEVTTIDGLPYLRFMRPMFIEEGCLKCHGHLGYKVGDIRGGVSVAVPLAPYFDKERTIILTAVFSFLSIWAVGMAGIQFGWRRLRRDHLDIVAAQEAVHEMNRNLERRVGERTAELDAANQELEAFSYSVSHDLRAPLNHITGFAESLLEDYGEQVDETGRDYLQRLERNSRELSRLVDDILKLSRTTRGEMVHEPVNLSAIVESVLAELREEAPDRNVEVAIQPSVTATGDPRLLRVALENLLRNAWKFTGGTADARIAFGETERHGRRTFFVQDNGAGFDMAQADKLFAPFKRLHSADRFPGSGIGLATVRRVIHRHGGEIVGEGAVGKGATFYFTLQ